MQQQAPLCPVDLNKLKKIFLISKLDKNGETWRRIDERVKNALNVPTTSNIPFLDYHFTIYNVLFDGNHPSAMVFQDPNFVNIVKQAYVETFCSRPELHLLSVFGRYDLFPKPTAEKPKPFPRNFVRHYELASHKLDAQGNVERDAQGNKVSVDDVSQKKEVIYAFRKAFREAVQNTLGCKLQRSQSQMCPGYTLYECKGRFLYAVPDYYHGVGVWEPHLSLFNEMHLKNNNRPLFDKEQKLATDNEKLRLLQEEMSKKRVEPISNIYFCRIPPGARGNAALAVGDLPELTYSIDFKEITGSQRSEKGKSIAEYLSNLEWSDPNDPVVQNWIEIGDYLDQGVFNNRKIGRLADIPEIFANNGILNPIRLSLSKSWIERYVDWNDFVEDIKDMNEENRYLYDVNAIRATNSDSAIFMGKRTYAGMQQLLRDWLQNSL